MFSRLVATLALAGTTLFGALTTGGGEPATQPKVVAPPMVISKHARMWDKKMTKEQMAIRELALQDLKMKVPTEAYWDRVAQCESRGNWKDKGTWAGGLGIYTKGKFIRDHLRYGKAGTWEYWGGEEYAPSPDKASKNMQMAIANRIALFGYKATFHLPVGANGKMMTFQYHKKPVGFGGWGCIRNTIGKPRKKDLQ